MGMMGRIKKKKAQGFKELVINMESSSSEVRSQIFTSGYLEDPVFMAYALKNIRTFDDFLNLSSDDIFKVISGHGQLIRLLAKCLFGMDEKYFDSFYRAIPLLMGKLKDELKLLDHLSVPDREAARVQVLKVVRKFQLEERIDGFSWILPPDAVYVSQKLQEGECKILFENKTLLAQGSILKGKRSGGWMFYSTTGKLFAKGSYDHGLKTGPWIFYYGNGNKKAQGDFVQDEKSGLWLEWDREGHVMEKGH